MEKILVISDVHIGYEESLNEQGIFVPRVQFEEIARNMERIFKKTGRLKKVIITGDLKHEFGEISSQEWRETREFLDYLKENTKKIILVKGNHDTILAPIANREELQITECHVEKDTCFVHGDKLHEKCTEKGMKMIVCGHRHPAVTLSDEYKKEKYKCFLVGKWKGKKVIVMPSFFPFIEGSEVNPIEDYKMFVTEKELRNFEAYVIGDEVYRFGKVKGLIKV